MKVDDILGGGRGYTIYSASQAGSPHPNRCQVVFAQNGLRLAACLQLQKESPIRLTASPGPPCLMHRLLLEAKYCFMSETLNHATGKT